ncbi:MAG: DUF1223 domain-containing protein [Hyphomicrobiales bacterium]|nr:DUF1223 domain-containing protein [Hyphomicrobiales bacterium]
MTGSLLSGFGSSQAAATPQKQVHVLELFTSQGCSSCPPADKLLKTLAERDDVIALSFPVSYWDYLGWRDTLAKEEYNIRQKYYAKMRGDREIYTPQIIVDGLFHVVGSRADAIDEAIGKTTEKLKSAQVSLDVKIEDGKATVTAGSAPDESSHRNGRISLICFSKSVGVKIGRGENYGRNVTYINVARDVVPVGAWDGNNIQYTVDLPEGESFDGVAAVLQENESAAVLGAISVDLSD